MHMHTKTLALLFLVGCGPVTSPPRPDDPDPGVASTSSTGSSSTGGTSGSSSSGSSSGSSTTGTTSGSSGGSTGSSGPAPGTDGGACNVWVDGGPVECQQGLSCALFAPTQPYCASCGVQTDTGDVGNVCPGDTCLGGYTRLDGVLLSNPSGSAIVHGCFNSATVTGPAQRGQGGHPCVIDSRTQVGWCLHGFRCFGNVCQ